MGSLAAWAFSDPFDCATLARETSPVIVLVFGGPGGNQPSLQHVHHDNLRASFEAAKHAGARKHQLTKETQRDDEGTGLR